MEYSSKLGCSALKRNFISTQTKHPSRRTCDNTMSGVVNGALRVNEPLVFFLVTSNMLYALNVDCVGPAMSWKYYASQATQQPIAPFNSFFQAAANCREWGSVTCMLEEQRCHCSECCDRFRDTNVFRYLCSERFYWRLRLISNNFSSIVRNESRSGSEKLRFMNFILRLFSPYYPWFKCIARMNRWKCHCWCLLYYVY